MKTLVGVSIVICCIALSSIHHVVATTYLRNNISVLETLVFGLCIDYIQVSKIIVFSFFVVVALCW
jgi:hypothetical protein